MLEQELAALEALGQRLAHRLLDHARTGEADQRARLGDVQIAEHRQARRHAARGRVGHHRDERQPLRAPGAPAPRWSSPSASATAAPPACARRRVAEKHTSAQRCSMQWSTARLKRSPTTEPIEPPRNWNSNAQATTGSPCSLPASTTSASRSPVALLRLRQAVLVALAVLELQRILRRHAGADLADRLRVEERAQPLARADAHVVAALGADVEIALELGAVQHRIAGRALDPQALGHRTRAALGLDARGHDLLEPRHGVGSSGVTRRPGGHRSRR